MYNLHFVKRLEGELSFSKTLKRVDPRPVASASYTEAEMLSLQPQPNYLRVSFNEIHPQTAHMHFKCENCWWKQAITNVQFNSTNHLLCPGCLGQGAGGRGCKQYALVAESWEHNNRKVVTVGTSHSFVEAES